MKVRKYQATEEKSILTALIVHTRVLGQVASEFSRNAGPPGSGPFKSKWSNLVADWCFKYYGKHRKAPKGVIQDIFTRYAQKEPDDDSIKLVESFLGSLSGEYVKLSNGINEAWILEKAGDHFDKVRLERMKDAVDLALESHDLDRAREAQSEYKPVSFSRDAWLNPFSKTTVRRTLERLEKVRPLVQFKGDLGKFLSDAFERDAFISFAGPEKRGKSYWLQETVWTALNQRKKVLYYVLGDMSEDQVNRRLYSRMTGRPKKMPKKPIKLPSTIRVSGKDENGRPIGDVNATESKNTRPYNERDIFEAINRLRINSAQKMMPLRVRCKGAGIISASEIESDVRELTEQGFVPDVIVIDYADLLAPEPGTGRMEIRHQIDATWKVLRRISTDYHMLVVTATQAAARSYDRWLIQKGDFSEDKRKNAHVTGMIGINQSPAEKKKGLYRLNWIFLRDGDWTDTQYVWTAGNLALGCPCLRSALL